VDAEAVMGTRVVTVNDVLDGHVALDIQCLDRVYLNAYVPTLQTSAQVVAFLSGHLGYPFPSPTLFNQIGRNASGGRSPPTRRPTTSRGSSSARTTTSSPS
jgi:hypothetical protein